ncbi:1-acyl-sn-glycerol-3-phosphate acyltransferase [Caulobacter mirabilis]|uniref:Acyltransferase n=1 Tax=Caulobacter mirabilis TaxID=69666 RepID=A0A2D2B4I4_9CAUL|nr:1-acyl-sn-glycerol-3-phosphate acyltransferase [Caulobacter mirabilis]ATQ45146.1 acyltransferase [Caulobacter mirabilis]
MRRSHIVDVLIEERAPRLSRSPAWPLVRPLLYRMLDYRKARAMADAIGPMDGKAALDFVSDLLALHVEVSGLERLPREGRCILVCNHPTGIADGVAVFDALKGVRPDILFYANSDAHRVAARFDEVLIPVEWVEAKRTRERTRLTLAMTRQAMEAERALAVFPAGRLARRGEDGVLTDPPWMPTAISVAAKYAAPIVPLHLEGPWATLFHLFDRFSQELRDITLFHELLNKRGRRFRLIVGQPIAADRLDPDAAVASAAIKAYVERVLPASPDTPFK